MKRLIWLWVLSAVLLPPALLSAQNVTGYGMMPDPFLFLIREPAVHAELDLSALQRQNLVEMNQSFDGVLLATRNMRPEESQKLIADVMRKSRERAARIFSADQATRLRQMMYRLRGLPFVLLPDAASELALSAKQKETIESAVTTCVEKIQAAQTNTYEGPEAYEKTQRAVAAARKEEQDAILRALSETQRQKLVSMVGRKFDPSTLGRVTFKAPELAGGTEWINSSPLTLEDLKGKVVALHFWAFG